MKKAISILLIGFMLLAVMTACSLKKEDDTFSIVTTNNVPIDMRTEEITTETVTDEVTTEGETGEDNPEEVTTSQGLSVEEDTDTEFGELIPLNPA